MCVDVGASKTSDRAIRVQSGSVAQWKSGNLVYALYREVNAECVGLILAGGGACDCAE